MVPGSIFTLQLDCLWLVAVTSLNVSVCRIVLLLFIREYLGSNLSSESSCSHRVSCGFLESMHVNSDRYLKSGSYRFLLQLLLFIDQESVYLQGSSGPIVEFFYGV